MRNNPYTVEGQIEGLARFSRGLRRARGAKKRAGLAVWLVLVAPFVLGMVIWIAVALSR